jgi:hypothetical protein
MNPNETPKTCGCDCSCKHHFVTPIAIIIIGLSVLAGNLGYLSSDVVGLIWPFMLLVIGTSKLCKCCGCK